MAVWIVSNDMGDILKVYNTSEKAFMFVISQIYNYAYASDTQKMEAIREFNKSYEKNSADYSVELGERIIYIEQCEVEGE